MLAFEITDADIVCVYERNNLNISFDEASIVLDDLNIDLIEDAALYGDELDEQTEFAYQEIERQLKELGHMS